MLAIRSVTPGHLFLSEDINGDFSSLSPQMYVMLNIRIVLVGLEIWKHENIISTDGGAGDVLANFVQWREKNLVLRRRHDSAQFVL